MEAVIEGVGGADNQLVIAVEPQKGREVVADAVVIGSDVAGQHRAELVFLHLQVAVLVAYENPVDGSVTAVHPKVHIVVHQLAGIRDNFLEYLLHFIDTNQLLCRDVRLNGLVVATEAEHIAVGVEGENADDQSGENSQHAQGDADFADTGVVFEHKTISSFCCAPIDLPVAGLVGWIRDEVSCNLKTVD